jgi:hypothetical protein
VGSKVRGNKVISHPKKEEIIKRLLDGESTRSIEDWLKSVYPKNKKMHVSYMTLQKFRKEHLNVKEEVLDHIKQRKREVELEETNEIIKKSSAYKDKLDEIVNTEIDVTRRLLELEALISGRLEFYYNLLEAGGTLKDDKVFLEYINAMRSLLQDWKKFIEGYADKKVEHNININVVQQQISIMKGVVCEVLTDLDPSLVSIFVDKLNNNLNNIAYDEKVLTLEHSNDD